jgi:hypothetical protein
VQADFFQDYPVKMWLEINIVYTNTVQAREEPSAF